MSDFEMVDWEKFRHDLAFPHGNDSISDSEIEAAFNYAVGICSILPRFYGEELERTNLWKRIESALSVAASRCSRADEIPDCMLSHICADTARTVSDRDMLGFFKTSKNIKLTAFKQVISTRRMLIVCMSREKWMEGNGL